MEHNSLFHQLWDETPSHKRTNEGKHTDRFVNPFTARASRAASVRYLISQLTAGCFRIGARVWVYLGGVKPLSPVPSVL